MRKQIFSTIAAHFLIAASFLFSSLIVARAAQLTVTSTGDTTIGAAGCADGCSLREAVAAAAAGDTIGFGSPTFDTPRIINLTSAELLINKNLTINGTGARLLTVRRAIGNATNFRVFNITGGLSTNVNISGMTISNGNSGVGGGGVFNDGATLTLNAVAISGNTGAFGGGFRNNDGGRTTILNSTISGNTATTFGGGVRVTGNGGTVNIANSTISGNTSPGFANGGGGGINNNSTLNLNNVTVTGNITTGNVANSAGGVADFGTVNIRNSIIAGNTNPGGNPDVTGSFTSNGNNLIGDTTGSTGFSAAMNDKLNVAANLGALANNGGQTDTHALLESSPAIDAGDGCVVNSSCAANNPPVALTTDQRAFARPVDFSTLPNAPGGDGSDIGAYELQALPTAGLVSVSGRVLNQTGRAISKARVTIVLSNGVHQTVLTNPFGYYSIGEIEAGSFVIISVSAKNYQFETSQIGLQALADLTEINFCGMRIGKN